MFFPLQIASALRHARLACCMAACMPCLFFASGALAADTASPATKAAASAAADSSSISNSGSSAPAPNTLRIHYRRSNGDEALWGVYAWEGPQTPSKTWIGDRFMFSGKDSYGGYTDIPLAKGKIEIRFLVTNAQGYKNCGTDQNHPLKADVVSKGQEMWVLQASCEILDSAPAQ